MDSRSLIAAIINRYDPLFEERVLDVATTYGIAKPPTAGLKFLNKKFNSMSNAIGSGLDLLDAYAYFGINNPAFAPFTLICWKRGVLFTANGGITPTAYGWKNNMLNGYLLPGITPNGSGNYQLNNAGKFATIYEGSGSAVFAHNIIDGRLGSTAMDAWYALDGLLSHRINQSSNNLNASSDMSGIGFKSINRESSTNVRLENKAVVMNRTAASTSLYASEILIGRRSTVDPSNISGLGYTEWGIGAALTNTQTQALRATTNQALSDFGLTPIA